MHMLTMHGVVLTVWCLCVVQAGTPAAVGLAAAAVAAVGLVVAAVVAAAAGLRMECRPGLMKPTTM
jgi:hypothetical protein